MPKKNLFYGNSVLEEVCGGGIAIKKTFWHTGKFLHTDRSQTKNTSGESLDPKQNEYTQTLI